MRGRDRMRAVSRLASWTTAAVLAVLLAVFAGAWLRGRQETDGVPDEQEIARSLAILRTSSPTDRKVLKVLFYGQSITRSGWDEAVVQHWHERYPNTVFAVKNLAIGGFASKLLEQTTERDIVSFYPDLIIFHVYGDHRAYERILRLFRSRTAADVIVQTDHGQSLPDLPCVEGLRRQIHLPEGCAGIVWVHQRQWSDEMAYHLIPRFAKRYGLAVEPQRAWWRDYLVRTGTKPEALLADGVHPNTAGKELIAKFFNQYFDGLVDRWNGEKGTSVVSYEASQALARATAGGLDFAGDRIELITPQPLREWPSVHIDGRPVSELDGCYEVTRAESLPTEPMWPAVRRVELVHDRIPEEWTVTVTEISEDQKHFRFGVKSSVGGDEGRGDSDHDFVARSGRIRIAAENWMMERSFEEKHVAMHAPFDIHWSVYPLCSGVPEVISDDHGPVEYRYVLGSGLGGGRHVLQIGAGGTEMLKVRELRAYMPPLAGTQQF